MAHIGKFNKLEVIKKVDFGFFLDGEELGKILLPRRYALQNCKIGDIVEVFIYLDSEDRIIATTEKPYAIVDDVAFLKVVSINSFGAFLDCGLSKDLLTPFSEQKRKMEEGKSYIVKVFLDQQSKRIAASSKLNKFIDKLPIDFQQDQEVDLLICTQTDLGYKAIINSTHWGILYKNEVFQVLKKGQQIKGFIKKVRDDKKIDLCLHKPGYGNVVNISEKIIDYLKKQGGFISVTDKTSPEIIYNLFGVSKKNYKKALGDLYKRKLIALDEDGITLIDNDSKS